MARFHNLFLALRPPLSVANQIMELRRSIGLSGQWLSRERLHISLLSLGQHPVLPLRLIDQIEEVLADVELSGCRIEMDQLVRGRKSVLLTSTEPLHGVRRLQRELRDTLRSSGMPVACNLPRAHITLGYNASKAPTREIDPLRWTAKELVLIDSLYGEGKHLTMARWPLGESCIAGRGIVSDHPLALSGQQLSLFV